MNKTRPAGMSKSEKVRTWNAIEQELKEHKVAFSYVRYWKRAQSRVIAFTLGLLILLGGGTTAFARSAMPGDVLFPVALATEKAQILFAGEKDKETLHIRFAEKRLTQVRAIASETPVITASTTAEMSTASSGTPVTAHKSGDAKKLERAKRARAIAESELTETRDALLAKGNTDAVLIIDDIIAELRGVGSGSIAVTRLSAEDDGKISLRATLSASSSATSTFSGRVKIEEKKNGTTITLHSGDEKIKIITSEDGQDKTEGGHDGISSGDNPKNDKIDDDEDRGRRGDDEDGDSEGDDRRHDDQKITVCHKEEGNGRTIKVSTESGRAHMSHGDTLGRCDGD